MTISLQELQIRQKIERLELHQKHIEEMNKLKSSQEVEMDKFLKEGKNING